MSGAGFSAKLKRDRAKIKRDAGVCINGPMPSKPAQHGPVIQAGKCQRCLDVHRASVQRRADRETHCRRGHMLTDDNVEISINEGAVRRRCRACHRQAVAKWRGSVSYTPIEDVLKDSYVRVLRAMRWFDWVEVSDLMEALEAPDHVCKERATLTQAVSRLTRNGDLDRRKVSLGRERRFWRGHVYEVRITAKGRMRLASAIASYNERLDSIPLTDDEIQEAA